MQTIYSPDTREIINELKIPRYINCKEGFIKFFIGAENSPIFMGHTKNLRAATATYGDTATIVAIAKQLIRIPGVSTANYFCIVQPTIIAMHHTKEII